MAVEFGLETIVNVLIFLSLGLSSYIVFYFSQKFDPYKQVTVSVFILALGLNLIGLSHLFRIGTATAVQPLITFSALLGALFTFIGFILVFYKKSLQVINLKERYDEVNAIIANLKDKYYKQEISEEDLRTVHSGLLKELAELEVKMKKDAKPKKSS